MTLLKLAALLAAAAVASGWALVPVLPATRVRRASLAPLPRALLRPQHRQQSGAGGPLFADNSLAGIFEGDDEEDAEAAREFDPAAELGGPDAEVLELVADAADDAVLAGADDDGDGEALEQVADDDAPATAAAAAAADGDAAAAADGEPAKRKRGRPRKDPNAPSTAKNPPLKIGGKASRRKKGEEEVVMHEMPRLRGSLVGVTTGNATDVAMWDAFALEAVERFGDRIECVHHAHPAGTSSECFEVWIESLYPKAVHQRVWNNDGDLGPERAKIVLDALEYELSDERQDFFGNGFRLRDGQWANV